MIIIHRCSCGHPDIYHHKPDDPHSGCSAGHCTTKRHEYGPPETMRTFNNGKEIAAITKPGGRLFSSAHGVALCGCKDCLALYVRLETARTNQE